MGITNMLNQKGVVSAAQPAPGSMPEQHPVQHPVQQLPPVSFDRADSPHGSEHSRYSQPPMNGNLQNGRAYGSPAMHAHSPLHMPEPNMAPSGMQFPPAMYAPQPQLTQAPEAVPQPATKAYQCSTCPKSFARRSDLARHGLSFIPVYLVSGLRANILQFRAHPHGCATSCLRLSRMWQAVHPAICLDRPPARPHRRETAHVRAMWQGELSMPLIVLARADVLIQITALQRFQFSGSPPPDSFR